MTAEPAHGGRRRDPRGPGAGPVARDYLLLALRLDQHVPGIVDGYYGPAALKAQVDMEQLRSPARLPTDAAALRERLDAEVPDDRARRHWLDLQLVALETLARHEAGEAIPYLDQVTRCFAFTPSRRPDARSRRRPTRSTVSSPGEGRSPSGSRPRTRAGPSRPSA